MQDQGKVVNIYIVYEISKNFTFSSYSTLKSCLFSAVSLTENANIDKHKISGYWIGLGRHGYFSYPSGDAGRNVDMSSSTNINNQKTRYFNSW